MIWQDFVFLAGSMFSIFVLAPTLRSKTASVPWGTSFPSAFIGLVYSFTFFTLDMTFSAAGALVAGGMWSLIALFRHPNRNQETTESKSDAAMPAGD